jgi:methionyl-tRNA formyltransferase
MTRAASVRTVFMGSDPIALPFLDVLEKTIPEVRLEAVVTQPDRPRGRGQKPQSNAIKEWALKRGHPVLQPERCGPAEARWVGEAGIDLVLVMAYGQILKPGFLAAPRRGIYNLHTSLLPSYRGASPIHTALAEGETVTGVSFMRLIPEMDAGPVLDQERVVIGSRMTAPELVAAMAAACLPLIARVLPRVLDGEAREEAQDPGAASYCRRLFKEDAALDFAAPAAVLDRRIRAFQPWPGALCALDDQPLRIGSASPVESRGAAPGTIQRPDARTVRVDCGEGALELLTLQRPGGRMLAADEFLRGFDLPAGAVLRGQPMAPLVAPRPFPWNWRPGDPLDAPPAG